MSDIDLTFVDPDRRDMIQRRIRIVEEFLAEPGRRAAERCALELGMGVTQFYHLARIWREKGRPEALSGAVRRRPSYRHPDGLDDAELALVRGTEAGMSHELPLEHVIKEIYRLAKGLGVALPSRPTVRAAAATARRERLVGRPAGIGLAVDHCAVALSVPWQGTTVVPIATLVLDLEGRRVVGLSLDPVAGGPRSTALALLDALGRVSSECTSSVGGEVPIELNVASRPDWTRLIAIITDRGLARTGRTLPKLSGGLTSIRLLGKDVGGIRLKARTTHASPGARPGRGTALGLAEAEAYARSRLIAQEAGGGPLARLAPKARDGLAADLRGFVGL